MRPLSSIAVYMLLISILMIHLCSAKIQTGNKNKRDNKASPIIKKHFTLSNNIPDNIKRDIIDDELQPSLVSGAAQKHIRVNRRLNKPCKRLPLAHYDKIDNLDSYSCDYLTVRDPTLSESFLEVVTKERTLDGAVNKSMREIAGAFGTMMNPTRKNRVKNDLSIIN